MGIVGTPSKEIFNPFYLSQSIAQVEVIQCLVKRLRKGVSMNRKLFTLFVLLVSMLGALFIGGAVPLMGTSISAVLIGAIIRHTPLYDKLDGAVNSFVTQVFLKLGIVLLGFTLSLRILNEVGFKVLIILISVVAVSITLSFISNRYFKLDSTLALLIGVGTSICGGAAITAVSPVVEAEEKDMAMSITTMFIYSMLALLILPTVGVLLNFTDQFYGILAGAAVNDTASVVATSFDWSTEAGGIATVVKLVRTLLVVPVTIGATFYKYKLDREAAIADGSADADNKIDWGQVKDTIPMFVVFFVLAVIFATFVPLSAAITGAIGTTSKMMMTFALVTIGFGVHIEQIKQAGIKPVLMGAVCWFGVLTTSATLIMVLYG